MTIDLFLYWDLQPTKQEFQCKLRFCPALIQDSSSSNLLQYDPWNRNGCSFLLCHFHDHCRHDHCRLISCLDNYFSNVQPFHNHSISAWNCPPQQEMPCVRRRCCRLSSLISSQSQSCFAHYRYCLCISAMYSPAVAALIWVAWVIVDLMDIMTE